MRNSGGPVESDFLTEGPDKKGPGRPSEHPDAPKCGFCGKNDLVGHECNAEKILRSIAQVTCEVIASETIKNKMKQTNSRDLVLKSKLGRPLEVTCNNCEYLLAGSSKPSKPIINSSTLMKLQSRLNLSGRKAVLAGQIFGEDLGLNLEPHFKNLLIKKGHELDQFFTVVEMEFEAYAAEVEEKDLLSTLYFLVEWLCHIF